MDIRKHWLTITLLVLVLLSQYSLWFGKEGWVTVWHRRAQLSLWKNYNAILMKRNRKLEATVYDLLHGREVMTERARYQLGFTKPSEVFYYVYGKHVPKGHTSSN